MEAMIIIIAALIAIVLLDAGYRIALCLVCWAPCLVFGLFAGWLADRYGAQALQAVWVSALAALIAKRVGLPIFFMIEAIGCDAREAPGEVGPPGLEPGTRPL